jgi:hypothetical protein
MTGIRSGLSWTLSVFLIAVGGSVAAQEANEVFLDATYLGAPTDWCPADAGVPLVIKMDGPDIITTPKDWPRTVRVRRGGKTSVVVGSEEYTRSLQRRRDFDTEVIGRFSAEYRVCQDPWSTPRVEGRWRLKASDGSELDAGDLDDAWFGLSSLPFFRRVSTFSDGYFAKIGDRVFFTADSPNVTTSQTFAAGTDKE